MAQKEMKENKEPGVNGIQAEISLFKTGKPNEIQT